jgi:hypothetical protein
LRRVNAHYDLLLKTLTLPSFAERLVARESVLGDIRQAKEEASYFALARSPDPNVRSRWYGSLVLAAMAPAVGRMHYLMPQHETDRQLTIMTLGLAAFMAEKGKYPDKLDALAPDYLKTVPTDFFSGKGFLYKPSGKGYLLYSVGENMIDDGGKDRDHGGDDLVVEVKSQ